MAQLRLRVVVSVAHDPIGFYRQVWKATSVLLVVWIFLASSTNVLHCAMTTFSVVVS